MITLKGQHTLFATINGYNDKLATTSLNSYNVNKAQLSKEKFISNLNSLQLCPNNVFSSSFGYGTIHKSGDDGAFHATPSITEPLLLLLFTIVPEAKKKILKEIFEITN